MAKVLPRMRGNGLEEQVAHFCHTFLVHLIRLILSALVRKPDCVLLFFVRKGGSREGPQQVTVDTGLGLNLLAGVNWQS